MEDFGGPESPTAGKTYLAVLVVVAATMIGTITGLLIADRNVLLVLKENISGQLTGVFGKQAATASAERTKSESSTDPDPQTAKPQGEQLSQIIPIGLPAIEAIRYSDQSGSAQMDFDLGSNDLVGTGVLDSPDRIYVDLQESGRVKGPLGRLKARKAVRIESDPLSGVRITQWESGAMRIVLDLSRACHFMYRVLPGSPSRLVLELRPRVTVASVFN